jgi:histidyl-tRNA synthetase
VAVIEGADERARGEVTLKDLALGAQQAKDVKDRDAWSKGAAAQITVARPELAARVKAMLARP